MLFGRRRRVRVCNQAGVPRPTPGEHPFTIVRNGYSTADVAAFLAEISADTSVLRPQDLRRASFQVTRRGYDKAEVLAYLTRVGAELEAELAEARAKLRQKRLANIDPLLAEASAADAIHQIDDSPRPQASQPVTASSQVAEPDIEIFRVHRPDPTATELAEPAAESIETLRPVAPRTPPTRVEPEPTVREASDQIAELLRESHNHAVRLRSQAEADVRSTVDAAQAEIDQRRRNQMRELDEQRHLAEMEARQLIAAAKSEADAMKTAAQAVLTQAKAEIQAVKALARHNMAEIEAARADAIRDSQEMLALGRGMLQSVVDLDRRCATRLERSDETVRQLLDDSTI